MKKLLYFFALCTMGCLWACGGEDSGLPIVTSDNRPGTPHVTGKSGSVTSFVIREEYMYCLDNDEIITYHLADPDRPTLVSVLTLDLGLETIFPYEDYIYVGSTSSLYIVNVSDPAHPRLLSKTERATEFIGGCDPVVVQGNYAYSTVKIIQNQCGRRNSRSALLVYDVSNKQQPMEISMILLNQPNGLAINGDFLFVCDTGSDMIRIFNVSNPVKPVELTYLRILLENAFDIIIERDKMLVAGLGGVHIYNISDIYNIFKIGTVKT